MHRALWLLLWLRLRGWLRYAKRNVSSVRGVLFLAAGLFLFGMMLLQWLVHPAGANQPNAVMLDRFGPMALLGFCLLNVLTSTGDRGITFRPAEVDFLFPGPFTRRQLLLYKVDSIVTTTLFQALFFLLLFRQWAERMDCAYLGMVLLLLFIQFFSLVLSMLASAVGARAYSIGRKVVLAAAGLAIVGVVAFTVQQEGDLGDTLARMEQSSVWHVISTPLSWFIKAFRATSLWPDFVLYGGPALLVDLALVGLVLALDAQYLEASATASERLYQRLQRLRSGQGALAGPSRSGKARFSLPMPPRLGGIGPTLWRQWLLVVRSYLPLLLVLILGGMTIVPALGLGTRDEGGWGTAATLTAMLIGFPLMLTPMILCDFRGDVDRMDVLKASPIPPVWLAVGQLLAPALLLAVIQAIVAIILMGVLGRVEPLLLAVPLVALPANFVVFAVENLLFLLFPVRLAATGPGDFQTSGRYLVAYFAKFLCLGPIILMAVLAGVLTWFLTRSYVAAIAAGWVVTAGCGIALIPAVVLAFQRFDVARDTPE